PRVSRSKSVFVRGLMKLSPQLLIPNRSSFNNAGLNVWIHCVATLYAVDTRNSGKLGLIVFASHSSEFTANRPKTLSREVKVWSSLPKYCLDEITCGAVRRAVKSKMSAC